MKKTLCQIWAFKWLLLYGALVIFGLVDLAQFEASFLPSDVQNYCTVQYQDQNTKCHSYEILFALIHTVYSWFDSSKIQALTAIAVAIFTWVLSDTTKRLWETGQKQAEAAARSADAAIGLKLPFIQMEPDTMGSGYASKGGITEHSCYVNGVKILNGGDTRAFPIEISWGWTLGQVLPEEPTYSNVETFGVGVYVEPDGEIFRTLWECGMVMPQGMDYRIYQDDAEISLWFYVELTYEDFMGTKRNPRFCWRWSNTGLGMAWRRDNTPAYNRRN